MQQAGGSAMAPGSASSPITQDREAAAGGTRWVAGTARPEDRSPTRPPAATTAFAAHCERASWTPTPSVGKGRARMPMALVWTAVAVLGAYAISVLAFLRGETVNAVWFVVAAVAIYAIAYRF